MIIAVDQSLSETGIAVVFKDGRVLVTSVQTTPEWPWLQRMETITREIMKFFSRPWVEHTFGTDEPIEAFVMESYAYGGSSKGFALGELGGVIKWTVQSQFKDLPFFSVVPAHHKMFVARNGAATKDDTIKGLKDRFNLIISNDNMADAASMALLVHTAWLFKAGQIEVERYDRNLFESVGLLDGRTDLRKVQVRRARKRKKSGDGRTKTGTKGNLGNLGRKSTKLKVTPRSGLGDLFNV